MAKIFLQLLFDIYRPFFIGFFGLNTAVLGILTLFVSTVDRDGFLTFYIGRFWARLNLFLSGTRFDVEGWENIRPDQSYIVMSNHQSHYDVFTLFHILPLQLRWVMKAELRHIPIFGPACERMGQIYVDRGHSDKARKSLEMAGERIRNGASVAFFPEGTRSPNGQLLPFKKGGFITAIVAGVPILPLTINGSRDVLRPRTLHLLPGRIRVTIHPSIDPSDCTLDRKEELLAEVRRVIEDGLDPQEG